MDLETDWPRVKALFKESFGSTYHYAFATVTPQGEPHVTPIGSLILGRPGQGFYFEKFSRQLGRNFAGNRQVCVLAVNSSRWYWLRSLLLGRFTTPPAVRLMGEVGDLRPASEEEIALWQRRVRSARFTKGHALMWRSMSRVREIRFSRIEPVDIGAMTRSAWDD